jgi:hypothetical protein
MSLGAIDFGLIVDGSVVMIENVVRHLAEKRPKDALRKPRWFAMQPWRSRGRCFSRSSLLPWCISRS